MSESKAAPGKKVAIVGFTASKDLAPWDQPGWEIWLCNNLWKLSPPQWDRLYDLHESEEIVKDREHDAFLRGQTQKHRDGQKVTLGDRPVYCFEPRKEWPTAVKFPRDEITAKLGNYFTNSISWMIAHALMEIHAGADKQTGQKAQAEYVANSEIHVYGVDMATGGEYAAQRPSCEYLLGIAVGMGIKVYIPPQSDLLKTAAMYGTGGDTPLRAKMEERKTELQARKSAIENQLAQFQTQLAQIVGALETTNYIIDVWTTPRAVSRHGGDDGAPPEEVAEAAVEEAQSKVEVPA